MFTDPVVLIKILNLVESGNYADVCSEFEDQLAELVAMLEYSPSARRMVRECALKGLVVGYDALMKAGDCRYLASSKILCLGDGRITTSPETMTALVGGLRCAWHNLHDRTVPADAPAEDFLRYLRCEEADIEAFTCLVAWELRAAGYKTLWRYLLSSGNGDIAIVFSQMQAIALQDTAALKAAHDQWFADKNRVSACDHLGLELLDEMLSGGQRIFPRHTVSQQKLQSLGLLPGPRAVNYLRGTTFTASRYDGLQDDINRAHLRHILSDMGMARA